MFLVKKAVTTGQTLQNRPSPPLGRVGNHGRAASPSENINGNNVEQVNEGILQNIAAKNDQGQGNTLQKGSLLGVPTDNIFSVLQNLWEDDAGTVGMDEVSEPILGSLRQSPKTYSPRSELPKTG